MSFMSKTVFTNNSIPRNMVSPHSSIEIAYYSDTHALWNASYNIIEFTIEYLLCCLCLWLKMGGRGDRCIDEVQLASGYIFSLSNSFCSVSTSFSFLFFSSSTSFPSLPLLFPQTFSFLSSSFSSFERLASRAPHGVWSFGNDGKAHSFVDRKWG